MVNIFPPQVAGLFYPEAPASLRQMIENWFIEIEKSALKKILTKPFAMIVPHGGYLFSGRVAAEAFYLLRDPVISKQIKQVILLAPAHQFSFMGIATHPADYFSTPLGKIKLDKEQIEKAFEVQEVSYLDSAFQKEHTVEVLLPFLQVTLGEEFTLAPFLIGQCTTQAVLELLEKLIPDQETLENSLILISSDLSHYQPYRIAQESDQMTQQQIINLDKEGLMSDDACGDIPIKALLQWSKTHQAKAECLALKNSGDFVGDQDKVVGYGAFGFYF